MALKEYRLARLLSVLAFLKEEMRRGLVGGNGLPDMLEQLITEVAILKMKLRMTS